MKKRWCLALLSVLSMALFGCGTQSSVPQSTQSTETTSEETTEALTTTEPYTEAASEEQTTAQAEGETTAHFICVGDNLIHNNIYMEALEKGGGTTYDFTDCYSHVKKYIEGSDLAVINQETIVTDAYEPSSYPTFASPTAVGDAIVDLGFNVISMANNHVFDKGADGVLSSLDYWDTKDSVLHYGAYRSQEDSEDIRVVTVNDITFAFLGYTEHTNGITVDGTSATVIYLEDTDTIKRQVEQADAIADVVVVSCHYGTEISHDLNSMQTSLTPQLVEWGADLIIGTQAHAVSTCEYLDKSDGSQAFVFYGLGNFFSTMDDIHALVGMIGELDVTKNYDTGTVTFENVKAIPVVSHYEGDSYNSMWYNCAVYPLAEYTDEMIAKHFMYGYGFTRDTINDCIANIPSEFLSVE